MLSPCCLCPLVNINGQDFVESVICVVTFGPFVGEYAAMCAQDRCGYFGESGESCVSTSHRYRGLVPAERMYKRPGGVPARVYPVRGMFKNALDLPAIDEIVAPNELVPPRIRHISEIEGLQAQIAVAVAPARTLKRTYAMLGNAKAIIRCCASAHRIWTDINEGLVARRRALAAASSRSVSTLLALLDVRLLPGVTESEFGRLFVKCDCGLITTQRAFERHTCLHEVIDLTGDE
jgi:hypothetical protein